MEMICYRIPPTICYQETELHAENFTAVLSYKLTNCINGNSNE
jgi:hypothetical protein